MTRLRLLHNPPKHIRAQLLPRHSHKRLGNGNLKPTLLQAGVDLPQDLADLLPLPGQVLVLILGTDLPGPITGAPLFVGPDIGLVDLDLDLPLQLVKRFDALNQHEAQVLVG